MARRSKLTAFSPIKGDKVINTFTEQLDVRLTEEELLERGQRLAQLDSELKQHDEHAKNVRDELKANETRLRAERTRLSNVVRNKKEPRTVECQDEAMYKRGLAVVIRLDDYTVVRERELHSTEVQESLDLEVDPAGQPSP